MRRRRSFRWSLGVRVGAHVTTLPAVPLGEFKLAPHRVLTAEALLEEVGD